MAWGLFRTKSSPTVRTPPIYESDGKLTIIVWIIVALACMTVSAFIVLSCLEEIDILLYIAIFIFLFRDPLLAIARVIDSQR